MALISNYLENKLTNHILRNEKYDSPENIWLALFSSNPTDKANYEEIVGGGYTRELLKFDAPLDGLSRNSENIIFHKSIKRWKDISHVGIFDAKDGGNMLYHGELTEIVKMPKGKNFYIKIGNLQVGIE